MEEVENLKEQMGNVSKKMEMPEINQKAVNNNLKNEEWFQWAHQ